jgi:outer membrane receptor protein involved in Fe transport
MLQRDDRSVFGFKASQSWFTTVFDARITNLIGVQARVDDIEDVGIFSTLKRQITDTTQNAGVIESNGAVYAESGIQWTDQLRTTIGARQDAFDFDVSDKMRGPDGSCNALSCAQSRDAARCFSAETKIGVGIRR